MPLPTNDQQWPPPQFKKALDDVAIDAAWYSGDRSILAKTYGRESGEQRRPSERRWFWGRQNAPALGQRDNRLHIPLAADIATTSADLLFSEPPTFKIAAAEGSTATQDRLDVIVNDGGLVNRLLEAAEVSAALSGVYLKVDWDESLARRPLLGIVHADAAVPEFRWGQLVAVTFWRELHRDGDRVLRHLERHQVTGTTGAILHGLYQGTGANLGKIVPLTEHPETAALIPNLTEGDHVLTGVSRITAAYVPNMRPNRKYRGSDLGRSDLQGVHDLLDALDETWTSWMRDLRLGRGRLVVPDAYMQTLGKGQGADFDPEREIYSTLQMPPTGKDGAANLTLTQFDIRVEQHARTAEELVSRTVATAGYSGQTFGLAGDVAATATEVTARERKSFITRDKKTRYWNPELAYILETMLMVDVARGFAPAGVVPSRPTITFGDTVSEDPVQAATTLDMLHRAQALSTQTRVERIHPDWDENKVLEEVRRIHTEQGMNVPDPVGGPLPTDRVPA